MNEEARPTVSRNEPRNARLGDIPGTRWKSIGKRVFANIGKRNLTLIAAGVAFYGMLAIFPALTALISVYGLVANPHDVTRLLNSGVLPPAVAALLRGQAHSLLASGHSVLGIGVIIGFLVTLWSARQGAAAVIKALNVAYGRLAPRSLFRGVGLSFAVTTASILFAVIALLAVVVVPAIAARLELGHAWNVGILALRWVVLVFLIACGLAILYRFVPNRRCPSWRWVACGAAAATVLWLAGSALFSVYVGEFASYNRIYGTIGTVVVLLLWLFISALIVLLGAEFNAAIEHEAAQQTQRDPSPSLL
ncbi:MAG: YihY/virulence factor BrkB family protein [Gammaproteobacteria bacterium]